MSLMLLMSHVAPWANRGERGRAWAAPPKEAAGRASRAAVLRQVWWRENGWLKKSFI